MEEAQSRIGVNRTPLSLGSPDGNKPMTIRVIDGSQRKAAKVAGLAYLVTFAVVVSVNFGIYARLMIGDNAETARNILAHQRLFRIGVAGDLFYCAGAIVLVAALYTILEPISRGLALLAVCWRMVWGLMWLAMTVNLLDTLRLLTRADFSRSFDPERTQALASLNLRENFDYYYVGLLFGALASAVCGYLWSKSGYIPRPLAFFGVTSSVFCVACTFIFFIFPRFDKIVNLWWFDTPMGLFDTALSVWFLWKGLKPPAIAESVSMSGEVLAMRTGNQ